MSKCVEVAVWQADLLRQQVMNTYRMYSMLNAAKSLAKSSRLWLWCLCCVFFFLDFYLPQLYYIKQQSVLHKQEWDNIYLWWDIANAKFEVTFKWQKKTEGKSRALPEFIMHTIK